LNACSGRAGRGLSDSSESVTARHRYEDQDALDDYLGHLLDELECRVVADKPNVF
jgi:hypothetical protein